MTPYEVIYGRFLSKITDYPLLAEMEEDIEFAKSVMHDYLMGAVANFTYAPIERLQDRDEDKEVFNVSLNSTEIEILAKFMIVEYLSPVIINSEKMQNRLTSKDFRIFSPANLIQQVSLIQEKERDEATQLMVENYYRSGFY